MALPKLFEATHTLSKDEWSAFGKYLLMHVRKDSDNYKLFKVLQKSETKLIEEGYADKIRTKHFPQMNPKTFSNLISRVFGWFEEWFSAELMKSDSYLKELLLNKGYNRRGLFKLANKKFNQLERRIHDNDIIDEFQQRVLFDLYNQTYYSNNPVRKDKDLFKKSTKAFINATTQQALALQLGIKNKIRLSLGDELSDEHATILKSMSTSGEDRELNQLLTEAINSFQGDEDCILRFSRLLKDSSVSRSTDLYLILTHHLKVNAIRLYNEGGITDISLITDAIRANFDANDLNPNYKLTQITMVNAVDNISIFDSYEETDKVIERWIPKVDTEDPESLKKYCKSINKFKHDRYDELPRTLAGIKYNRLDIKLNGQAMLMIALYVAGEEELLHSQIQNQKKQLKRIENKIPQILVERIQNFLNILKLLMKSKYDKSIYIDLADHTPVLYRSWVEKQI